MTSLRCRVKKFSHAWRLAILLALSVLNTQSTNAQGWEGPAWWEPFGKYCVGDFAAEIYKSGQRVEGPCPGNFKQADLKQASRKDGTVGEITILKTNEGYHRSTCNPYCSDVDVFGHRQGRSDGPAPFYAYSSRNDRIDHPAPNSSVYSILKNFKFPPPSEDMEFRAECYHTGNRHTFQQSKTIFVHDNCSP